MKYEDVFKLKKRLADLFDQKRDNLWVRVDHIDDGILDLVESTFDTRNKEFQNRWKSYLSKHNIKILKPIPTRREDVWNNRAKTVVIVSRCGYLSIPTQLANNILLLDELPP